MRNNYWGIKQTKELRNLSKTISCAVRTKNTTWTVNEWKHFDILCTRKHNFLCCNLCFKVRCAVFVLFSWKYQASIHLNPKHGTKSKDYTFFSNIGILILKGINNMAWLLFSSNVNNWQQNERLCDFWGGCVNLHTSGSSQSTRNQGPTGSRYPTRRELFFKYPTHPDPKIENDWVPGN